MGQLDSIEINELFFTGLICALLPAYVAEDIESTIENIKAYVYSAAIISCIFLNFRGISHTGPHKIATKIALYWVYRKGSNLVRNYRRE